MTTPEQRDKWKRQKKNQRSRAGNSRKLIQVSVDDEEAWRAITKASYGWSLAAATEAFIREQCQDYRREQARAQWEYFDRIRVGLIAREPPLDGNEFLLAKKPTRPGGTTPNKMTEEQEALANETGEDEGFEVEQNMLPTGGGMLPTEESR